MIFLKSPQKGNIFFILITMIFFSCSNPLELNLPQVLSINPENHATLTNVNLQIKLVFSTEMDEELAENNFSLSDSSKNIQGNFSWSNKTLIFTPDTKLIAGEKYYIELKSGSVSKDGVKLTSSFLSSFFIGDPNGEFRVTSFFPNSNQIVSNIRSKIEMSFNKKVQTKSIEDHFSISPPLKGRFQWYGQTNFQYLLDEDLVYLKKYKVTLSSESLDFEGFLLGTDFTSSFQYGTNQEKLDILGVYSSNDIRLPLSNRYFLSYQTNISKFLNLVFHFNKEVDLESFKQGFSLSPLVLGEATKVTNDKGCFIYYHFSEDLKQLTTYKISLSTTIKDLFAQELIEDINYFFKVNAPDSLPPEITDIFYQSNVSWSETDVNIISNSNYSEIDLNIRFKPSFLSEMNISSVQENISILKFAGDGDTSKAGTISYFSWDTSKKDLTLTLSLLGKSNYYKLSFRSGESGVRDENENYFTEDKVYVFYLK